MKFDIDRTDFLGVLARCRAAGDLLRITATEDVTVVGTNGNQWITAVAPAQIAEPGSAIVRPEKILAWAKIVRADTVHLHVHAHRIGLRCGGATLRLPCEPEGMFPVHATEGLAPLPFDIAPLIGRVRDILAHATGNDLRAYLDALHITSLNERPLIFATSGMSVAYMELPDSAPHFDPILLPSPAARMMEPDADAEWLASRTLFSGGGVVTRLFESVALPGMAALVAAFPQKKWTLRCRGDDIMQAVAVSQLITEKDPKGGNRVRLTMGADAVTLCGVGDANAQGSQTIDCAWDGPPRTWEVSADMLKKCVASVGTEEIDIRGSDADDDPVCAVSSEGSPVKCLLYRMRTHEIPEAA